MKNQRYRPQGNLRPKAVTRSPRPSHKPEAEAAPKLAFADKQSLPHYKKGKITLARFSWDKPEVEEEPDTGGE